MTIATFNPTIDARIDRQAPTSNYGTAALNIGKIFFSASKTVLSRTLINFDVSALTGLYTSIDSAELRLNSGNTYPLQRAAKLSRNRRASTWTELGVTWNRYDGTNLWTTAGCGDPATDHDIVTPPQIAFTLPAADGIFTITGLLQFITDAIALRSNVVALRLAMEIEADDGTNNGADLSSREAAEQFRPLLSVTYTPLVTEAINVGRRSTLRSKGAARPARGVVEAAAARPARPTKGARP